MRRWLMLVLALSVASVLVSGPAVAVDKLEIQIDTVDVPAPPAEQGTFTVSGEGADLLCPVGTWEAVGAKFWNWTDSGFKIAAERLFTCESGETFLLELRGTIVFGEGCLGCTWKLKQSEGFDEAPKGSGDIVVLSPAGESYVGFIKS